MAHASHNENNHASPIYTFSGNDAQNGRFDNARMAGTTTTESQNHLRAWREHRRMTQSKLADLAGTTGNVISQLESGTRGLSDKWLRRLAPLLGIRAGFLLEFHPDDASAELFDAVEDVPEDRRAEAAQVLRMFKAKGKP